MERPVYLLLHIYILRVILNNFSVAYPIPKLNCFHAFQQILVGNGPNKRVCELTEGPVLLQ